MTFSILYGRIRSLAPSDLAVFFCALLVFTAGMLDLAGWVFDIKVLKSVMPGWQDMSDVAGVCFVIFSMQLIFMIFHDVKKPRPAGFYLPVYATAAIGAAVIAVYFVKITSGEPAITSASPAADYIWHTATSVNMFTAVIIIIFSAALRSVSEGGILPDVSHFLAMPAFLAGYFVAISYILGVESTHEFLKVRIAFNTGVCFCAMGISVFMLNPSTRFMSVFSGNNFGSIMTRRMLPWLMALPVVIGWFRLSGERIELFTSEVGVILVAMTYTICFLALLWLNAGAINNADAQRREAEAMLAQAQKVAHLGSWELDLVSHKLLWSDEVYNIFGLKPQEFGATYAAFLEYTHPQDREMVNNAYAQSLKDGSGGYEIEHRVVRRDTGEVRVVHEKCEHLTDADGGIIRSTGMVHDITEMAAAREKIKSANEELTAMNEELTTMNEELNESMEIRAKAETELKKAHDELEKRVRERTAQLLEVQSEVERGKRLSDIGALASTVAHELRNPLATISMAAHNLKRKADNPALDSHMESIQKKVKDSEHIINNLLFYSRIKPPALEKVPVYAALAESAEDIKPRLKKGTAMELDYEALKDTVMEADRIQLGEVFNNLLVNALEAVPEEGGRIRISGSETDGNIMITVSDNGCGMDSASLEKAFEPFFTTRTKGTGLGLAVCRNIINGHGGSIRLESQPGNGTSAHLLLPKKSRREHIV